MITLGLEAQERSREALHQLDQALRTDRAQQESARQQGRTFHEHVYGIFELLERESLSLKEVFLTLQRVDDYEFEVTNKGYRPFKLVRDAELAFDNKTLPAAQGQEDEGKPRVSIELAARIFVVFSPPHQGLLRYYTVFGGGAWKRTTFSLGSGGGLHTHSALVPTLSPDVLVLEAIDLLRVACTSHPTWANLAGQAESLALERLRDRTCVKTHLSGLGTPRQ
jgi:hypothetical protein